jgi:hypothetical protein
VFKSWKQPLVEMQGKAAYIRPKVVDTSPDPALAGATCTGLPFYTCYEVNILLSAVFFPTIYHSRKHTILLNLYLLPEKYGADRFWY